MNARMRRRQGGYTFLEIMFVVAIGAACVGVAARVYGGADALSDASRHRMELASDLQAAHARVGAALRNASLATLTNLDATGTDHAPRFQVVEGLKDGALVLGEVQEIAYVRTHADFEGMGPVGRLELRPVGTTGGEILASQVVEGSWKVTLSARVCNVELGLVTTFSQEEPLQLSTESAVFLENP